MPEQNTSKLNNENLKSLYFVGLGVWSLVEEKATETFDYLKKEGKAYDKEITTRIEERKKSLQDWSENVKSRASEEWKSLTTKEGWEGRVSQAKTEWNQFTTKFPLWKKNGVNGNHANGETVEGEVVEPVGSPANASNN